MPENKIETEIIKSPKLDFGTESGLAYPKLIG